MLPQPIPSAADPLEWGRELIAYAETLLAFGLTFSELARASPKHPSTRDLLQKAIRQIADNEFYRRHVFICRDLPLGNLAQNTGVPGLVLTRYRRYMLAFFLLYSGDFPILQNYLDVSKPCAPSS